MLRHRDGFDRGAHLLELLADGTHRVVHLGLRVLVAESFPQQADGQAFHIARERAEIVLHFDVIGLARINAGVVAARQNRHHQRRVLDRLGHRADMIDRVVEAHDAGIGHQTVARLVADDTRPGGGNAHRAALIAADGEIDHVRRNGNRRAAGRAARVMLGIDRVFGRAVARCVAGAREAEIIGVQNGGDLATRLQKALGDCRVDVGRIVVEEARAAGQRNAGDAHRILQADRLAAERAGDIAGGTHRTAPDDAVQRIVRRRRPGTDFADRGRERAHGIGDLIDRVVNLHQAAHHLVVVGQFRLGKVEVIALSDILQILFRRPAHGHVSSPSLIPSGTLRHLQRSRKPGPNRASCEHHLITNWNPPCCLASTRC